MVRLLLNQLIELVSDFVTFQSHNGAIAATVSSTAFSRFSPVSIPQWCDCCPMYMNKVEHSTSRFNPTMVRLLPSAKATAFPSPAGFNPTMVRLLRMPSETDQKESPCFNPTMVRLLRDEEAKSEVRKLVSIPQWCDCCLFNATRSDKFCPRFNPTMVRLLPCQVPVVPTVAQHVSIPQWCDCCVAARAG